MIIRGAPVTGMLILDTAEGSALSNVVAPKLHQLLSHIFSLVPLFIMPTHIYAPSRYRVGPLPIVLVSHMETMA